MRLRGKKLKIRSAVEMVAGMLCSKTLDISQYRVAPSPKTLISVLTFSVL